MSIYTSGNPSKWDYLKMVAQTVYNGAGWAEKATIALWVATCVIGSMAVAQGALDIGAYVLAVFWASVAMTWMSMATLNKQLMVGLGQSVIDGTATIIPPQGGDSEEE